MKLTKILVQIFLSSIILIFGLYVFLLSDYNSMFNNQTFITITKSIEKSKTKKYLDLILIYSKTHNVENVNNRFIKNKKDCPCLDVIRCFGFPKLYPENSFKFRSDIYEIIYTNKLEESYTQEDCLFLLFSSYDFSNGIIGVDKASKYYFNKNYEQLNQSEKINLVLMIDNLALYNPFRNKKLLPKKIKEFKLMIDK